MPNVLNSTPGAFEGGNRELEEGLPTAAQADRGPFDGKDQFDGSESIISGICRFVREKGSCNIANCSQQHK